jgi:hypothetical protein
MNATQLRTYFEEIESDDLSADDSCDEDEEDVLEKREIVESSELDEEEENENYEAVAIISKKIMPEPVLHLQGVRGKIGRSFLRHTRGRSFLRGRGSIGNRVALEDANLLSQHANEIIDHNNESEIFQPNIKLGRQNKAKNKAKNISIKVFLQRKSRIFSLQHHLILRKINQVSACSV